MSLVDRPTVRVNELDLKLFRQRQAVISNAQELIKNKKVTESEKSVLFTVIKELKKENGRIINKFINKLSKSAVRSSNRKYPMGSMIAVIVNEYSVDVKFRIANSETIYTEDINHLEYVD